MRYIPTLRCHLDALGQCPVPKKVLGRASTGIGHAERITPIAVRGYYRMVARDFCMPLKFHARTMELVLKSQARSDSR